MWTLALTLRKRCARVAPWPQVKILREPEGGKVGPDGKPRSKGMGFIEFT